MNAALFLRASCLWLALGGVSLALAWSEGWLPTVGVAPGLALLSSPLVVALARCSAALMERRA